MRFTRVLPLPAVLAVAALLHLPSGATAHPEVCDAETTTGGIFTSQVLLDGPGEEGDFCLTAGEQALVSASRARVGEGEVDRTQNLKPMANLPKTGIFAPEPAFNSDIAFQGQYAYQGNYEGIQVTDISNPVKPVAVAQVDCVGAQNDVSVLGDLLITSTDSSRAFAECYRNGVRNFARPATAPSDQTWEGIRVFDISNPRNPQYLTAVETDCGSHTHTLLPDPANNRLLVYVSSYGPAASQPDCQPPHDKISIVAIPLSSPRDAFLLREDVLFPDGGFPGSPGTRATAGCHDITVYPEKDLAAGACMGEGAIIDISNKADPKLIASVTDPNFAFWHSATFNHDATKVIFTDELGGGGGATCNAAIGPVRGADAIYDISDPTSPTFLSYYKISREQGETENCVAHNGMVLPRTDRDVFVQSWYQGGISIIDFTDGRNPKELAYFDRGPLSETRSILGGSWSAYYYNGLIYSNDIQKGLDVLKFSDSAGAPMGGKLERFNAQLQETPPNG